MQNEICSEKCRCLITLEESLLKATPCLCDTVFPAFTVFCTLGIKELDAFSSFYIASKMDFFLMSFAHSF